MNLTDLKHEQRIEFAEVCKFYKEYKPNLSFFIQKELQALYVRYGKEKMLAAIREWARRSFHGIASLEQILDGTIKPLPKQLQAQEDKIYSHNEMLDWMHANQKGKPSTDFFILAGRDDNGKALYKRKE